MKIQFSAYLIFSAMLFGASCNNSSGLASNAGGSASSADSNSPSSKRNDKERACCFVNEDEGQLFFPAASGTIKPQTESTPVGDLNCSASGDSPSSFAKVYVSGSGKMTLRINDYCINPRRSQMDYDVKKKNTSDLYGKDIVTRDITDPTGAYSGFAIFSPSQKNAYLHVVVDGRFSIVVTGIYQQSIEDVISLFKMVPIDKLVAFKK